MEHSADMLSKRAIYSISQAPYMTPKVEWRNSQDPVSARDAPSSKALQIINTATALNSVR